MRNVMLIVIILLLGIVENTIAPSYSISGSFPSLVFVFAIAFSIVNEIEDAMLVGIVSGIVQDIYFFDGFGVNLFLNFLLCLIAVRVGKSIYVNKRLIPVITVFILSAFKSLGVMLIFNLIGRTINTTSSLTSIFMNAILMLIVYKIILNASKKYWKKETWRFK